MDINGFKQKLKSGSLGGAYIFAGEEDYLVRHYLSELRRAVGIEEAFAVFNNPVYDGDKLDFAAIAEDVKAPPMMSDYKLIEWRHADFSSMKDGEMELLEEIISSLPEYPYAVLAFTAGEDGLDFGTPKKPSAFIKRFDKSTCILRFEKSTDGQLYAWLKKHFDAQGVAVTLDTLKALVFRAGHTMDVLKNEVDKLSALAKARQLSVLTEREVEEVASTTPECDTYAFSNAITERNRQKAYAALEEMKHRRVDPAVIMGMIARTFGELLTVANLLEEGRDAKDVETVLKMNQYKVKIYVGAVKRYGVAVLSEIVSSLARTDAASKYGGITGYTAIELFISKNI